MQSRHQRTILRLLCAIAWLLVAIAVWELRSPPRPESTVFDAPVRHVNFDNVPRSEALKVLSKRTGARLDIDWTAMGHLGILPDTPINVRIESATLGETLKAIFTECGIPRETSVLFEASDSTIRAITEDEQSPVTCVYDIAGIVESDYTFRSTHFVSRESGGGFVRDGSPTRQECAEELSWKLADMVSLDWSGLFGAPPDWMKVSERYLVITRGHEKQKRFAALIAEFHRANSFRTAAAMKAK